MVRMPGYRPDLSPAAQRKRNKAIFEPEAPQMPGQAPAMPVASAMPGQVPIKSIVPQRQRPLNMLPSPTTGLTSAQRARGLTGEVVMPPNPSLNTLQQFANRSRVDLGGMASPPPPGVSRGTVLPGMVPPPPPMPVPQIEAAKNMTGASGMGAFGMEAPQFGQGRPDGRAPLFDRVQAAGGGPAGFNPNAENAYYGAIQVGPKGGGDVDPSSPVSGFAGYYTPEQEAAYQQRQAGVPERPLTDTPEARMEREQLQVGSEQDMARTKAEQEFEDILFFSETTDPEVKRAILARKNARAAGQPVPPLPEELLIGGGTEAGGGGPIDWLKEKLGFGGQPQSSASLPPSAPTTATPAASPLSEEEMSAPPDVQAQIASVKQRGLQPMFNDETGQWGYMNEQGQIEVIGGGQPAVPNATMEPPPAPTREERIAERLPLEEPELEFNPGPFARSLGFPTIGAERTRLAGIESYRSSTAKRQREREDIEKALRKRKKAAGVK